MMNGTTSFTMWSIEGEEPVRVAYLWEAETGIHNELVEIRELAESDVG